MSKRKASDLLARFNSTMDAPGRPADEEGVTQPSPAEDLPADVMQPASPATEPEPPQRQHPRRPTRRRNREPTSRATTANPPEERPKTMPNEPVSNLGVRARESLDNRVLEPVHQLRLDGVRSSKAEIVEMLLWELPAKADDDFR